jgi:hypothetical protein
MDGRQPFPNPVNFRTARSPARIEGKLGDHLLQTDFPFLIRWLLPRFADCASNWIYDPQNILAFLEYYPVSGWHISLT